MKNWLSLGPASSSTVIDDEKGRGRRYTVCSDVAAWLDRKPTEHPPCTIEDLDQLTLVKESLLMGFRHIDGVSSDMRQLIPATIDAWRKRGLLEIRQGQPKNEITALTKEGLLFLNRFLIDAFSEVDKRAGNCQAPPQPTRDCS